MYLKFFFCALVAIIAGRVPSLAEVSSTDIAGVNIGMTPDQVKDAIAKANPKLHLYETSNYRMPDGSAAIAVLSFRETDSVAVIDTFNVRFSGPQSGSGAYYLGRKTSYSLPTQNVLDNPGPRIDDLEKALTVKYGKPDWSNRRSGVARHFVWQAGNPQTLGGSKWSSPQGPCLNPERMVPSCKTAVDVTAMFDRDLGLTTSLSIEVFDHEGGAAALKIDQDHLNAISKARDNKLLQQAPAPKL